MLQALFKGISRLLLQILMLRLPNNYNKNKNFLLFLKPNPAQKHLLSINSMHHFHTPSFPNIIDFCRNAQTEVASFDIAKIHK